MESRKCALLVFVAMTVVLLAMATPIVFAARNQIVYFPLNTNEVDNIRTPLANIFLVQNCIAKYLPCVDSSQCCSGECLIIVRTWEFTRICQ